MIISFHLVMALVITLLNANKYFFRVFLKFCNNQSDTIYNVCLEIDEETRKSEKIYTFLVS